MRDLAEEQAVRSLAVRLTIDCESPLEEKKAEEVTRVAVTEEFEGYMLTYCEQTLRLIMWLWSLISGLLLL